MTRQQSTTSPSTASQSTDSFSFRNGQQGAFDSVVKFLRSESWRASYIHATGSFGKTVLYIKAVQKFRELNPHNKQVLVIADSRPLLTQIGRDFASFAPELSIARASKSNPFPTADVVTASLQRCRFMHKTGQLDGLLKPLIIVDEAHGLLGRESKKVVEYMLESGSKILGGTATDMYFSDKKLSDLLGQPCFTLSYQDALELGVVAPFSTAAISLPFDMSKVKRDGSDYNPKALATVFEATQCAEAIAAFHKKHCPERKGFVQCLGVTHAQETARILSSNGITAVAVTGNLSEGEMRQITKRRDNGEIQLLCGARMLTQGIDWPQASVAYNFPSASVVAVKQRGYRVTRLDPSNPDKKALVVEILPQAISKHRPPLIFQEVVLHGASQALGSGGPSRARGAQQPALSSQDPTFLPDEVHALRVIDQVLRGSGPWARLQRQALEQKTLATVSAELAKSTGEFLEELTKLPHLAATLQALTTDALEDELVDKATLPEMGTQAKEAIERLAQSNPNHNSDERQQDLRQLQRFIFARRRYSTTHNFVVSLGLTPAMLVKLLPSCISLEPHDLVRKLASLNSATELFQSLSAQVAQEIASEPPVKATLPRSVTEALGQLASGDEASEQQQAQNVAVLSKFLFSPRSYTPQTKVLKTLGLSSAELRSRFRSILASPLPDPMQAALKAMDASGGRLIESFEPLIECEATLLGVQNLRKYGEIDWYAEGAQTLIHSMYQLDVATSRRLQTYLKREIQVALGKLCNSKGTKELVDQEPRLTAVAPRRLRSLVDPASNRDEAVLPDNWYREFKDALEVFLTEQAEVAIVKFGPHQRSWMFQNGNITKSLSQRIANDLLESLSGGTKLDLGGIATEFAAPRAVVNEWKVAMTTHIKQSFESQYSAQSTAPQVVMEPVLRQIKTALRSQSRAPLERFMERRALYLALTLAADPFDKTGEQIRASLVLPSKLQTEVHSSVNRSGLPESYKEVLSQLIHYLSSERGPKAPSLFAVTSHGWLTAKEAARCLTVLLAVESGDSRSCSLMDLAEVLPFKPDYEDLFAANIEPDPKDVIVDFLSNKLKFPISEYAKSRSSHTVTPAGLLAIANGALGSSATAWSVGVPIDHDFQKSSSDALFGKTLAELRTLPRAPTLDSLYLSYLTLAMQKAFRNVKQELGLIAAEVRKQTPLTRELKMFLNRWNRESIQTIFASSVVGTFEHELCKHHLNCPVFGDVVRQYQDQSLSQVVASLTPERDVALSTSTITSPPIEPDSGRAYYFMQALTDL